jgi:AraC-like DNA-binding protein
MDEIAFEAGFNARQSLYRVFKKIIGLSPGAFRRNRDIDG